MYIIEQGSILKVLAQPFILTPVLFFTCVLLVT